jgi:hypothetical protein
MHASPAEAGVHLPVARAAATWVPAFAGTADRSRFHASRVGEAGGRLGRNYPPAKGCHCEEPQGDEAISTGVGTVAPRLLRFARNDSLVGSRFHASRVGEAGGKLRRNKGGGAAPAQLRAPRVGEAGGGVVGNPPLDPRLRESDDRAMSQRGGLRWLGFMKNAASPRPPSARGSPCRCDSHC